MTSTNNNIFGDNQIMKIVIETYINGELMSDDDLKNIVIIHEPFDRIINEINRSMYAEERE